MDRALECPRYYALRYLAGSEPVAAGAAASTGTAFHAYRSAYIDHLRMAGLPADPPWVERWLDTHAQNDDLAELVRGDNFHIQPATIYGVELFVAVDSDFRAGRYNAQPRNGLAAARRIAHKTFVSLQHLRARARAEVAAQITPFGWYEINHPVESYLLHQGEKFVRRFDANSYLRILDAWQWFNLLAESGAANYTELFSRCRNQEFLVFSIDSDAAFPPAEQAKLVKALKAAHVPVIWITVHSDKGHDSFLIEPHLFAPHVSQALHHRKPARRAN